VNADGTGEPKQLSKDRQGTFVSPTWTPDGKLLVYGTRYETQTGLRVRDLGTGEEPWLKHPIQRDEQESRATRDLLRSRPTARSC
jgi:Tol biopolymer transport system component